MCIEMGRRSDQAAFVVDSMAHELHAAAFIGDRFRNRRSEAARNIVLIGGHQDPAAAGGAQNGLAVERLDCCHVDDPDRAAFCIELSRRLERGMRGQAASDDRQLIAFDVLDRLADRKRRAALVNLRPEAALDAEVDRLGPCRGG